MASQVATYRFGPYELRTPSRELYKGGTRLRLRPQSYHVLQLLVTRAGDTVHREEFRKLLWPAETVVDFELGLNTCVKELRGILNDSASEPRYIETLPKLGYRIIVRVEADQPAPLIEETATPRHKALDRPAEQEIIPAHLSLSLAYLRPAILAGFTLFMLVALGGYYWSRPRPHTQPLARSMVAVLPFENLTGDAGQDYFTDGLTEEMIAQLGRHDPEHLGVIARTSIMHYKHSPEQLDQIARELGVQYVLEGSVRREAGRVRITAQLIQMKDQTHLLSRQYDREVSNLLALQAEIAQEIADEIQLTLGDPHKSNTAHRTVALSTPSYEAYDCYLKGRYFWNQRTAKGFQQAAEYFQQAIAKDPKYARAYAGLADTFGLMSTWNMGSQNGLMPKARAAALKALELDETLAEAHTSLALIAENYDYDWQTAEREFRRAIQLDPAYATAHQWYAEYLSWQGRIDEALAESERARQLDPLSLIIATDHGAILYFSRQYDRAIAQFRSVIDMDPHFHRAMLIVYAYVEEGRFAEALDEVKRRMPPDNSPWTCSTKAYVYGRWGRTAEAQHALMKLEQIVRPPESDLLFAYVGTGRKDQAIALLQKAYVEHSSAVVGLKVDPAFDPLRGDPRFQALLGRVWQAQ
jgi:TolB-like protein/DNA-binding winged helix-turn-helix (wHTH) protein/Tfp pilus assembly protein PilF